MNQLQNQLQHFFERLLHLRVLIFVLFLVILYGGIAWRVQTLANAAPDEFQIASQLKSSTNPRIDEATIEKIKQLQDNSVNVQALFDQARKSPFQE